MPPGPCAEAYALAAQIAAPVLNGQIECPKDMAGLFDVASCKLGQEVTDSARKKVDEKILCELFCCCLRTGGNQACVEEALTIADQVTGYKSRYKAEVSYNMQFEPPRPMMEKDKNGALTTEPISRGNFGHLNNRAEIEYDPALRRRAGVGGYRYRRPDVVVVKDPSKPPDKRNISRVIEMKFPGDTEDARQNADYERIGGKSKFKVYKRGSPCNCKDKDKEKERQRAQQPMTAGAEAKAVAKPAGLTALDWAILLGLGTLTVVAVASPFDGLFGEGAAGTATATQYGRMFSSPILRPAAGLGAAGVR